MNKGPRTTYEHIEDLATDFKVGGGPSARQRPTKDYGDSSGKTVTNLGRRDGSGVKKKKTGYS